MASRAWSHEPSSSPSSAMFPSFAFLRADGRRPAELRELHFSTCVPSQLTSLSHVASSPARQASSSSAAAASQKEAGGAGDAGSSASPFFSAPTGQHADGRSLVSFGSTKVAAFVFGPRPLSSGAHAGRSRPFTSAGGGGWSEGGLLDDGLDGGGEGGLLGAGAAGGSEKASILCRVGIAAFSGDWRADVARTGGAAEEHEVALSVRKVVEGVVMADAYPRSLICLFVHVVENDGGILAASICAASLALIDAGIATKDFVAAMSCVYMPRQLTPLLDPPRAELQTGAPTLTVAMLISSEEVSLLQLDGQVPMDVFEQMYQACAAGCREVGEAMKATVCEAAALRVRFGDRVLK
ncbi:3' exoribonuclease family, domain 1 domain-containing protein [Besnoitia besnoiti]|uniref:3' exoribonuclease family, domain 1 domain-containing protein n=1 Tax=Besnoitia besnoiti TaxID=94643 RepID=A0A2A9MQZ7_BESBE|nr:3' exoribonuclease family, domain 1 domain-containing protein [Besnoitia besnoiti]PFH38680.1 3' exoribonuclease family, domain 1 domain-containing protein [Besnoitia besnoiti]